jgi:hypothetical protein
MCVLGSIIAACFTIVIILSNRSTIVDLKEILLQFTIYVNNQ